MKYRRLKERNSQLLADDIRSKNTVFRGLPEIVNLNHTEVCNLRCIMCFQAYTPGKQTLPQNRVEDILGQLLPTAKKLKLTTAGEPIIGKFEEIVDLARQYECKLELITNATRLTRERFEAMEDVLDHIVISLDSHERESLDHIRGKGVYDRIIPNIEDLVDFIRERKKDFVFSYHFVLMTSNVPHLKGFVKFAKDTGADKIQILRMHYMTEKLKEEEDPFVNFSRQELDGYIHAAQEEARRLDMNLFLEEVGYSSVKRFEIRDADPPAIPTYACNLMVQEVYVQANEEIYPCCIPSSALNMGSLKSKSFRQIWNGRKYRHLRKQMFSQRLVGPCANCKMYATNPDDAAYNYVANLNGSNGGASRSFAQSVKRLLQRSKRASL